ncbi:MAG: ferritin-like domain-containing protein [Halobacteriaceae archaeon]
MSVGEQVGSDHQLARLLQIGVVLEEVVEARAYQHYQQLPEGERDEEIEALLEDAREESARHRAELEELIDALDARSIPFEEIQSLVAERYGRSEPENFDDVLYDQLNGEETAYKFYDDLLAAVEESDVEFGVDRGALVETLSAIRADEEAGVEEVTRLMEER